MNYQSLHRLLHFWESFEQETGRDDLSSFAHWLHRQHIREETSLPANRSQEDTADQIAQAVGGLYQHARHYIKTALRDVPLKGLFDFTFLATLEEAGDLRKSDLITANLIEFSPGMEVIRRLLRYGLIEDFDDPDDARSRRVRITAKGKEVFYQALPPMQQVTRLITGNLDQEERLQFLMLAQKLLHFHRPIWEQDLGSPLEDIIGRYLKPS